VQYGDLQMSGAVTLPLICAQVQDTDNAGLECWHAGCPANDPRLELISQRVRCYDLVLDSLTVFEDNCARVQPAATTGTVPPLDDPETVRSHAYELAFASEDEMFHSTLYDWLIGRGLADDLLDVGVRYQLHSLHILI
jgi:nuclear pore complex protein Nup155